MKNILQQIISSIGGYNSSNDDWDKLGYWDQYADTKVGGGRVNTCLTIQFVKDFAEIKLDTKISDYQARQCVTFLDAEFLWDGEMHNAYQAL